MDGKQDGAGTRQGLGRCEHDLFSGQEETDHSPLEEQRSFFYAAQLRLVLGGISQVPARVGRVPSGEVGTHPLIAAMSPEVQAKT